MRGRGLTITPAVLGLIGVALLVFESVQAMRRVVLGTAGTTLLFAGLGLVVIAATFLVVSVSADPLVVDGAADANGLDDASVVTAEPTATAPPLAAEPDVAATWTVLCRTEGAGRLDAGGLDTSLRRGASLTVFHEGVLVSIGKAQRHRTWAQVSAITAQLGGSKATITVHFDSDDGKAEATFTGKSGDLAPAATALVSAAPEQLVTVSYS